MSRYSVLALQGLNRLSLSLSVTLSPGRMWNAGVGPTKDAYTIAENPQFLLKIGPGNGSVWVLLTRHITAIEDFRHNREYITVVAYENGGRKVYYPCESWISHTVDVIN